MDLSVDPLPDKIREAQGFCSLEEAVKQMHFPTDRETLVKARERLVFDEFFRFILVMRRVRDVSEQIKNAHPMIAVDRGAALSAHRRPAKSVGRDSGRSDFGIHHEPSDSGRCGIR